MATLLVSVKAALWARIQSALYAMGEPQRPLSNSLIDGVTPTAPRWRPMLLVGMVLLCLALRVWMAAQLPSICPDALVYFRAADAIDQGDVRTALGEMKLNTLPAALAGLHRLGLNYEQAGMLWGLLMSCAAVLPLFGWLRRQFDDRVAIVACFLYAIHPGLIERSPEVIREPTFWFLFLFGMYASWRAASEARISMYLVAGITLILAVLTRFEGALLLIPLVWWTGVRALAKNGPRLRLFAGLTCALALGPAILLVAQFTVMPQIKVSSLVRMDPLVRAEAWLNAWGSEEGVLTVVTKGRRVGPGLHSMLREFALVVGRGMEPVLALLLLSSLVGWTGLWKRRDVAPLLLMALLVLMATWIHLWFAREGSSRYVLTAWVALSPLAALGLLWPQSRRELLPGKMATNCFAQGLTAAVLMLGLTVYGCIDAVTSNFDTRRAEAELGRWIARHYGSGHSFAGSPRDSTLVAYYAASKLQELPPTLAEDSLTSVIEQTKPDVLLVARDHTALCTVVDARGENWGLEEVDPRFFPEYYTDNIRLFVKRTDLLAEARGTVAASTPSRKR